MTHIHPTTCPADMKRSARNAGPAAPNRSRRHGIAVSYDGVTAAYLRDISTSLRPRRTAADESVHVAASLVQDERAL